MAPHADLDMPRKVLELKPPGVQPLTCRGLLTAVSSQRLAPAEGLERTFVERMDNLREEYLDDVGFPTASRQASQKSP